MKKQQDSFLKLYVDELKDLYSAEKQLTKALPKMAKAATSETLRDAFLSHLEETNEQVKRLEQIFANLEEKPGGKKCAAMEGLIEEGKEIIEEDYEDNVTDAALIGAAQRVEHYEMAAYGTAIAFSKILGFDKAASLLEKTIKEEKAADEKLNAIATREVNPRALESREGNNADEMEEQGRYTSRSGSRDSGMTARSKSLRRA